MESLLLSSFLIILLAALAAGIGGPFINLKEMNSAAGGIAHASLGGLGLAMYLGYPPVLGALVFAVAAGLTLSVMEVHFRERLDTLIAALWSTGMAMGIIFIYLSPGYQQDLHSWLFGNLLLSDRQGMIFLLAGGLSSTVFVLIFYRQLELLCVDTEAAVLQGLNTTMLRSGLYILVALVVVAMVYSVGIILSVAVLSLPASSIRAWTRSLGGMLGGTLVFCLLTMSVGFYLSWQLDLPAGPVIVLICTLLWLLSRLIAAALKKQN